MQFPLILLIKGKALNETDSKLPTSSEIWTVCVCVCVCLCTNAVVCMDACVCVCGGVLAEAITVGKDVCQDNKHER